MPADHTKDTFYIEGIVRQYISYINNRAFASLRSASYIAPVSTGNFEHRSSSGDSIDNHVNAFEEHCKRHPDRKVHIVDITTTFENGKRASTFVNTSLSTGGVSIPGATFLTLRKTGDEWQVTSASAMRGPGLVPSEQSTAENSPAASSLEDTMSTPSSQKESPDELSKEPIAAEPVAIQFEEDGPEAIKTMLVSHARHFIELHNSTAITSLLDAPWVAPYFLAGTANRTSADINMQTYVQRQVEYLQAFPQFSTRLVNVQAELDPSGKTATVFVDTEQEGAPPGVKIPGIGILSWRADELSGKWYFWKLVVMRGNTGADT